MSISPTTAIAPIPDRAKPEATAETSLFGPAGFSFKALVDTLNPLQHLPVVSTVYRESTGESIGAIPRLLGGGLFGGIVGLIGSAINLVVEGLTGKDIGEHVAAAFGPGESSPDSTVAHRNYATERYQQAATLSAEEIDKMRGYMVS